MERSSTEIIGNLTWLMEQERGGLFRLCLRYCGQPDAAEDLVQETLFEAWRNRHKLSGPTLSAGWLYRIARHVCLRWRRAHGQEVTPLSLTDAEAAPFPEALEPSETAQLLDRAMAQLPDQTRRLLVGRYVDELPIAELAAREKLSENAMTVRLHRGRQALQKIITTRFHQDAFSSGLLFPEGGTQTATSIWCPDCGAARLVFSPRRDAPTEQFRLVCPACCTQPRSVYLFADLSTPEMQKIVAGVKGYRPILKRLDAAGTRWLNAGLEGAGATCDHCGHAAQLRRVPRGASSGVLHNAFHVVVSCPCERTSFTTRLGRIHHGLPEVQRFWSRATRIRRLPDMPVNLGGAAAILTRFESLTSASSLDVFVREVDFMPLEIQNNFS